MNAPNGKSIDFHQGPTPEQIMQNLCMTVLHRFVWAAGGKINVDTTKLPAQVQWNFGVQNGIATIEAVMPGQAQKIMAVPGNVLEQLPKMGPSEPIR